MQSHGAAVTTTDEVKTMLEDQRKIGMSFLHACLAMRLLNWLCALASSCPES
jgi:hypothetical protein